MVRKYPWATYEAMAALPQPAAKNGYMGIYIIDGKPPETNERLFFKPKDGYFQYGVLDPENPEDETGWKIHVSVNAEDVPRAWNLISDYLMDKDVRAKVVSPGHQTQQFSDPKESQAGKMMVLSRYGRFDDWQEFLEVIEQKFMQEGIMPGLEVKGDWPIQGSRYLFYRNDLDKEGKYISAKDVKENYPPERQYNPYGHPDPFEGISMQHVYQMHLTMENLSPPERRLAMSALDKMGYAPSSPIDTRLCASLHVNKLERTYAAALVPPIFSMR